MKRQVLALSLLFIAVTVVVIDAALVGGWSPIEDLKDKHVVEIAEFAVAEHNKEVKSNLKLESIVKGESQVVSEIAEFAITEHSKQANSNLELDSIVEGHERNAGDSKNCQLILTVKGGKADEQYEAVVNVSENLKALMLFLPLKGQKAITFLCFVGFIKGGKIGDCVSKPAAAAARKKVAVKRFSPPHQSPSAEAAVATKGHSGLLSSKSGQLAGNPNRMKGLFKSKPRTPADVVRQTRNLLIYVDQSSSSLSDSKREEKLYILTQMVELAKNTRELKSILYGDSESEPVSEACAQLTQEFFRENTLRLLIICLPKLNLETRKDATQVVANLQRQQVNSRLIASDYLEKNTDLLDILIAGYENTDMALHYGVMLKECIRHQSVARYVLESPHVKKFFDYIQLPNFDISADAAATFKELLTRHKSTVAEFLSKNYDWFFAEFNLKLLESTNYITRRQSIKLLGDMLLDRSNAVVMTRYVSSRDNLRILMNLLRITRTSISYIVGLNLYVMNPPLQESSKSIQTEAFHVFKLFVANQHKPPDIVSILVANRSKLLRLLADFKLDKEDEQFEADKAQVVKEIASLEEVVHVLSTLPVIVCCDYSLASPSAHSLFNVGGNSVSEFLETAVEAAKKAGEIIREGFYQTKHVEHKGQGSFEMEIELSIQVDLVTETDKACEALIFNHLKQQYPSHKLIGEETTAACGATELTDEPTWIVDPLDGTTNFVHGFPFVCISIGLTIGKVPTVGVVYNPIMDEVRFCGSHVSSGVHGKGAFLNGKPIKVSSQSELVKSLLATELLPASILILYVSLQIMLKTDRIKFWYHKAGTKRDKSAVDATTDKINSLLFKVRSLRMSGSCALNLCGIACGRIDLFYETGYGGPWDVAGGAVIVKEAGGLVYDPSGKDFDITSQRVAASNPLLKDAFVEVLQQTE
ncbi:hypothetical protein DKX38_008850 [Salix brachista]|uniref:inositol-phosphate phosphatase n=1 Tax=Salix brachista TaxID=2182728 RepID=A0A5N5M969_9ROSI|nr:hypothetical protein DKX38_008850 [Salix brachista]